MYAVMGVTGQVGSAVAENLLALGKKIRVVVRDPEKAASWGERGAEIAVADYADAAALTEAFRGAEGVFGMIPPYFAPAPGFPEARAVIAAIKAAIVATRPGRAVYLSTIGAQRGEERTADVAAYFGGRVVPGWRAIGVPEGGMVYGELTVGRAVGEERGED